MPLKNLDALSRSNPPNQIESTNFLECQIFKTSELSSEILTVGTSQSRDKCQISHEPDKFSKSSIDQTFSELLFLSDFKYAKKIE